MRRLSALLLLAACAPAAPEDGPEPLDLPEDPAAPGVPVGVRTIEVEGNGVEVWYPAADEEAGVLETQDLDDFAPAVLWDHLEADPVLPDFTYEASRDARFRRPEAPYPVVLFSHGLGGFRLQSADYARHLASRGYVVLASDHPSRSLDGLLPCLFSPPLEGCEIGGFGGPDRAEDDVRALLALLRAEADGFFEGNVDLERIGLSGHSAGGGTTASVGGEDPRVDAMLIMAAAPEPDDARPSLYLEGSCDFVATGDDAVEAVGQTEAARVIELTRAGHMAFADLCSVDWAAFADELLVPREDINRTFLDGMLDLVGSGCPGGEPEPGEGFDACVDGYLPIEDGHRIVRHYATAFFDEALRGTGPGVQPGIFDAAVLR